MSDAPTEAPANVEFREGEQPARLKGPPPPELEPSSKAVWAGNEYEVTVREWRGKVKVGVEHIGLGGYCGTYSRIDPRPPVWWKPWTWFRGPRAISRAVDKKIRKARGMEGRDRRGKAAAKQVREAVREALS